MKPILKKLSKVCVILLLTCGFLNKDYLHREYLNYKVGSLTYSVGEGRRIATAFKLYHNGMYFNVTNRHVCDSFYGQVPLDGIYTKVLYISKTHDICLLENDTENGLTLASDASKGDSVYLIGYPSGTSQTFSEGYVIEKVYQRFNWIDSYPRFAIEMSNRSYPGNSGSSVTNKWGGVVGVLFAGHNVNNKGLYIPSSILAKIINEYMSGVEGIAPKPEPKEDDNQMMIRILKELLEGMNIK